MGCSLLEAAGAGLLAADNGPVLVPVVMCDSGKQPVTKGIATRQRNSRGFGSRHDEAEILKSEKRGEPDLVVGFVDHDLSVDLVCRGGEKTLGHHFVKNLGNYTVFPDKRKPLRHGADRAAKHE